MEMLPKERVLCAFNNGVPDRVPIFDFLYSRKLYQEVIGITPEYYNSEDVMNCSHKIGYDLMVMPYGGVGGILNYAESSNLYQDEWGTTYKKDTQFAWPADAPIEFPLKDRSDWKNYTMPDPTLPTRLNEIKTAVKMAKETKLAVVGVVRGPYTATWLLFGIDRFSILLYDDPAWLDEVMEKCTDFSIEGGRRMIEAGVDAIWFADDYGNISAPFMSPAHFKKHIIPHLSRMLDEFKKWPLPVVMHSDGHIRPLLDLIVPTGINGYHPVEKQAGMDLSEIKRTYGKSLCLLGNVNNKTTLVSGSVEEVAAEAKECIRIAAPGGGYILTSDHSLHDDIPNENVFALYETGRKYGKYPIEI